MWRARAGACAWVRAVSVRVFLVQCVCVCVCVRARACERARMRPADGPPPPSSPAYTRLPSLGGWVCWRVGRRAGWTGGCECVWVCGCMGVCGCVGEWLRMAVVV